MLVILFLFEPNLSYQITDLTASTDDPSFPELLSRLTDSRLECFDEAEPLVGGLAFYEGELQSIAKATRSIYLEAFIFHQGKIADRFLSALIERANSGVVVRINIDSIGSFFTADNFFKPLRDAGGQVAWYQPLRWYNFKRLNNRTHRELLIVDGEVAFIGGAGIADHWLGGERGEAEWKDIMCRITGPIVSGLSAAFGENWLESAGIILADLSPAQPRARAESVRSGLIVRSTPSAARSTRSRVLFQLLIAAARTSIRISSPYFIPDKSARVEIVKAIRERGVKVEIVVPGPLNNHPTVRLLSRAHYGELLGAGVQIYEYQPSMIHTKCMLIDGLWSVLGSTNFDSRSFGLNDEINFVAKDSSLVSKLDVEFEQTRTNSFQITLEEWQKRHPPEKFLAFAYRVLERQE